MASWRRRKHRSKLSRFSLELGWASSALPVFSSLAAFLLQTSGRVAAWSAPKPQGVCSDFTLGTPSLGGFPENSQAMLLCLSARGMPVGNLSALASYSFEGHQLCYLELLGFPLPLGFWGFFLWLGVGLWTVLWTENSHYLNTGFLQTRRPSILVSFLHGLISHLICFGNPV